MAKHGKKYREKATLVDPQKSYEPQEAVVLIKSLTYAKFDETVELHMRMNVDPRRADQQIRSVVALPAGTGKTVRIIAFMEGEAARLAQEAGADYVGTDEYIKKIQDGWLEFDVAMATPQMMGKIGRLGRILGARGLMPNPKAGTVVQPEDVANVIKQLRQGRVEFRVDKTSNLHIPIGKVSFSVEQLMQNLAAVMEAIMRVKPASVKGQYIKHVTLAATMTPGVRIDPLVAQNLQAS